MRISPFKALRPVPDRVAEIISVPYDVVDRAEAVELARDRPLSFLRIIRSEIEFPEDVDPYAPAIYERARENLQRLIDSGIMIREESDCYYIYRLNFQDHQQTGLVTRSHVDDYDSDRIRKHELTRREKEEDRTRHVDCLNANTGPVFLTYHSGRVPEISRLMEEYADSNEPLFDVVREDRVRHRIYRILSGELQESLTALFSRLDVEYIADGHHRAASAARVCRMRREKAGGYQGDEPFNWFLSVSFPDEQLRILPYNRAIRDLNGQGREGLFRNLDRYFEIVPGRRRSDVHEIGVYLDGRWHCLKARASTYENADEIGSLDVSILQKYILAPLLGITDPRTSDRVLFVGGIRGEQELERLVNGGDYSLAFSLPPVTIEQLRRIADASKIMPPKSTWFEPKLCSGFLINRLD